MSLELPSGRWAIPGPFTVRCSEIASWVEVEGRQVAVFVQYPSRATYEPLPVVMVCHGLGGSYRGYAGIGARLASHGYAVLHPQFLDAFALAGPALGLDHVCPEEWTSDARAQALMAAILFDPEHWRSRVARAKAVIDSLEEQHCIPVGLAAENVVVVGHSFGAYTAQLLLGATVFDVGLDRSATQHRSVMAGVLLSPQGSGDRGLTEHSWDTVELPILVITATNDLGPHGEGLAWRRQAFDCSRSSSKYLAVVRDGDHALGGVARDAGDGAIAALSTAAAVSSLVAAFTDYVHGDVSAGSWLSSGPFPELIDHEHEELR